MYYVLRILYYRRFDRSPSQLLTTAGYAFLNVMFFSAVIFKLGQTREIFLLRCLRWLALE
jgi:hypothetical protein